MNNTLQRNNTLQNNSFPNNQLLQHDNQLVRVLDYTTDKVFIIDCIKRTMPVWTDAESLKDYVSCSEDTLQEITDTFLIDLDTLDAESRKTAYERYTMIAPLLPFVSDQKKRKELINSIASMKSISKQTIRYYLCLYLVYQNIAILISKQRAKESVLSQDAKNMRWALNKFFYTKHKNSLSVAYTLLLKEKYCDSLGNLLPEYPSFYQFRYFYRKTKKMQTYYISRDGLKDYQKNNRPLLGDGIQEYASSVVLDCHISRNRHLYHAFLHTAFDVICFSDMSEVAFARRIFHMGYCCFNVFDLEDKTGK